VLADPPIRFYAGVALRDKDGNRIGVFCVKDHKPREMSLHELDVLMTPAKEIEEEIEKRKKKKSNFL